MSQPIQTIIYTYKYINHESNKNVLYENMIKRNNNYYDFIIIKLLKKKYNCFIKSKL